MVTGHGLAGRVAVVTGAAGGIGRETARMLVRQGAGVLLTDIDAAAAAVAAEELGREGPGSVASQPLDVTSRDEWERALRVARRRFGYPSLLVNNAGTLGTTGVTALGDEEWDSVVGVSQRGTWLGMQMTMPCIHSAGGGAVVNVSSVFGLVGSGTSFAYHAAKGATLAMTQTAAVELAPVGVRVNAVCPGLVDTDMTTRLPDDFVSDFVAATPLGRIATSRDIASAVLFLLSDEAAFITGVKLMVDGGYTAR